MAHPQVCQDCGSTDPSVRECFDPYQQELHGVDIKITVCENCYRDYLWDM